MSNGIVKVKEEYLDEAKVEAEGLISENYAFFKNKLTGFITSSTIGIEIYKEIITEELKYILAIEKSVAGLGKEVIDEEVNVHPKWDVKELISKYDSALKEGLDEDSVKKKDADYSLRIKYAMLGGFGASLVKLQEEMENPKHSQILNKCREALGKITISLPDTLNRLLKSDQAYIAKIIDYLEDKSVIKTKGEKDFGLLYGKYLITKLRYEMQRDELINGNLSRNKLYKQLRDLRIQFNGLAISEMMVEDLKTNRKIGDSSPNADISEIEEVAWDDVIGQADAKKLLRDSVVRFLGTYDNSNKQSIFETVLGTKPPKAVLLYGPPGTGKTYILKAVITEAEKIRNDLMKSGKIQDKNGKIKFIIITPDQIKDKYIGESAKAIKAIFNQAKKESPALLVIDEIDAFFSKRGDRGFNEGEREIVSILMQELDGIKDSNGYILVGITNMPKTVDKAILSRFDKKVEFSMPKTAEEVTELFRVYLKGLVANNAIPKMPEEEWKKLGEVGHGLGFTGRMIKQFVRTLEQERNDILTDIYKDNSKIVEEYHKNQNKMRNDLNEKSKKFTVSYISQKMGEFASHNQHAETYGI